ncbi:glycogen/starch/alpha-glucan phosphorylase [Alloacidobacterium dinghuense]|uniref:Alpha-1,4 glucan phosphorylase n=1 Tax=Alloacidobacterium dinghuense TaxID=2763107 RepID=A0A7G8BCM2_9BACT|nr:glycogen/starch/alpha-glucan phosphorylase [Alloacidobacterium dinghuense]QNI30292.1 glycogen/starch/alpha-glucan phosphorylase [Alloacidobacterium dinghuense]
MEKLAFPAPIVQIEDDRTATSVEALKRAILDNLYYIVGTTQANASNQEFFAAVAYTVRDRILARWFATLACYKQQDVRVVCYLSAEFLMGPHLANNLLNLDLEEPIRQAVAELGRDLGVIEEQESEPGLGNGGLGRLAACYLDSMATLGVPAIGYGIRYEFGIFSQQIRDGWQVELTDYWLRYGNPWEIRHPHEAVEVGYGGRTEGWTDSTGRYRVRWVPASVVRGVPYNTPIVGYRSGIANDLRLWRSESTESFYFDRFNSGDYQGAVAGKTFAENISKVLYPNDEEIQGKELRLQQQYFFTSCALQDMIRLHLRAGRQIDTFHEKWAIQLNDTHPSIGVAELMRLLVDEHGLDWEKAWEITSNTFSYTNHTLLPEALERWPRPMFASILPRHLEIINEINARFLSEVRKHFDGDEARVSRMSIIDEHGEKFVRMANLACVGSYRVNGVAALHTELLKKEVLRDFYELWPEKFINVTNGVTPRRWLAVSNPEQSALMTRRVGNGWLNNLDELKQLEGLAEDAAFRAEWRRVQHDVKVRLTNYILEATGISVDPSSMFDVLVKRIHEYKRQHLKVLHILTLYFRLKRKPNLEMAPRTFLFGGKAAPGYAMAKLIIKLINSVAEVVNTDPDVKHRLKVVFLPDYDVSLGQKVYPAADLSEQISTAGKEASGTGNMKFAMNGALTIGTLDGANIEIRDAVGHENFFLFGLTADQVQSTLAQGYRPRAIYESNPFLREVIDSISSGQFSHRDQNLFRPLLDQLLNSDPYLLFADYQSYIDCQDRVTEIYRDQEQWSRMAILNAARMGKFSSDRSIREYSENIWRVAAITLC